jgi:hypothetical protein
MQLVFQFTKNDPGPCYLVYSAGYSFSGENFWCLKTLPKFTIVKRFYIYLPGGRQMSKKGVSGLIQVLKVGGAYQKPTESIKQPSNKNIAFGVDHSRHPRLWGNLP